MMVHAVVMVALLLPVPILSTEQYIFPKAFFIGAATSSYQIEGAWDVDGKGRSIWDRYTHKHPDSIQDHSNGNSADKSYYLYREDVSALKELKMNMYRFSISWPRIMPNGLMGDINQKGIDYYNNLIDELLDNNIEPMVTMYHWDLPQHLQDLGGWANEVMVDYFGDYARVLYTHFGDRVKYWVTINEPGSIVWGYMKTSGYHIAPDIESSGVGVYLVARNLIKAHALAYHIYDEEFRSKQDGKLTMVLNWMHTYPRNPNSTKDIAAAERALQFYVGLFAHPVFSNNGDYPEVVKEIIAKNSKKEGYARSRLPPFSEKEIAYISGTADYFGLNMYTSKLVEAKDEGPVASFQRDVGAKLSNKPTLPQSEATPWLVIDPRSLSDALTELKVAYGDWEIIITESGYSDDGRLDDDDRILYLTTYMINLMKVMYHEKLKVTGYLIWSLVDNFEWNQGYSAHFGLYKVNMTDPKRTRIPKKSCDIVREIIDTKEIPEKYYMIEEKLYD